MKKIIFIFSILGFGFLISLLTGCATVVEGTTQKISIVTPPTTNATCSLSNNKGKWVVDKTPGTVMIHKSGSDLIVACRKPGYQTAQIKVKPHMQPAMLGNIILGGIIGVIVDAADGAGYYYPSTIKVLMQQE